MAAIHLVSIGHGRTADFVYGMMSEVDKDDLESKIGKVIWESDEVLCHDSDLFSSVNDLWEWVPGIISKCPYGSVAHDVLMIQNMTDADLDSYVMRKMI